MTNAELAILSLVAEQPRHGYEIENVIEQRGMRAWTEIGFSSIYYILKKLEKYFQKLSMYVNRWNLLRNSPRSLPESAFSFSETTILMRLKKQQG